MTLEHALCEAHNSKCNVHMRQMIGGETCSFKHAKRCRNFPLNTDLFPTHPSVTQIPDRFYPENLFQ